MDDLLKLVKTFRFTSDLNQRLRLGDQIVRQIAPQLAGFVHGSIGPNAAPDVLQETLKGIAMGLRTFKGATNGEFWAWCRRIALNKRNDALRRHSRDRLQPMGLDEMRQLLDNSSQNPVRTPGVEHDLEYAMKLLSTLKPECHDLIWGHYVLGLDYAEIAEEKGVNYDAVRMKISRCLDEARKLVE